MVMRRWVRYASPVPESGTPHRCMSRTCGGRIRDHATLHGDVSVDLTATALQCTECGGTTAQWIYDRHTGTFTQV